MRLLKTQAPKQRRKYGDGFDFLYRGNNVRVFIFELKAKRKEILKIRSVPYLCSIWTA
jgi:hypothetical protein